MAETHVEGEHRLHWYSGGRIGRSIDVLKLMQKIKARRSASKSVHNKNKVPDHYRELFNLIKKHSLNEARDKTNLILDGLTDGLQEVYNVKDIMLGLMEAELGEKIVYLKRFGAGLTPNDIALYTRFIEQQKKILDNLRQYINELVAACTGKEEIIGALNIEEKKYTAKGLFSIFRPVTEWWNMRSLAKEAFKLESRLVKKEEARKQTKETAHQIEKLEKGFTEDVGILITKMSIFALILIRTANKTRNEINSAMSTQRYDLPATFKPLSNAINVLINDEIDLLKSLNKSRLQLETLANKAESALNDARMARAKAERKGELVKA